MNFIWQQIRLLDIVDVAIVAYVIYRLILVIRSTRAVQLIKGIAIIFVASALASWLGLHTIEWLLKNLVTALFVALPIVFQPELRRALEQLGRGDIIGRTLIGLPEEALTQLFDSLVVAAEKLSAQRIGALIVLERETGLDEIIETGIKINGEISSELLVNIFIPNTPLHDGAVIIRANRLMAASCYLPLTDAILPSKELGTRHRAAIGITEQTDAVVLVVSEETGIISVCYNGKLVRNLNVKTLKDVLNNLTKRPSLKPAKNPFKKWREKHEQPPQQ